MKFRFVLFISHIHHIDDGKCPYFWSSHLIVHHHHHLMLLYTFSFIFHLSFFISPFYSLLTFSSTYVMYILLLSIKTDNNQAKEAAVAQALEKCSLFIMCYVHILNHKWTSVYKSLCLLFPTAFWLFPKIIYILHKGEKILSGRCHFHIYICILKYQ